MSGSNSLKINLLGPLELLKGKQRLELPASKKARALLAYLVAESRQHRRERLTDLFWDVADDPKGGLRWCLSKIRPLVDDSKTPRLVADRETVEFRSENVDVDLFAARNAVRDGISSLKLEDLEALAKRFRGTFLEGLDLPDYDRFQAWLVAVREDVLQMRISILGAIVKAFAADAAKAAPYARTLVDLNPADEQSRIQLCDMLMKLGRQAEARQWLEAGKRWAGDTGVPISSELARAEQELSRPSQDTSPHSQNNAVSSELPTWSTETTLIGREKETAQIRSLLNGARDQRQCKVLLLTGEPGVGKTRLLEEISSQVLSMRGTLLSGRSYEAEARRPYGPWVDGLRSLHPAKMGDVLRENLAPLLTGQAGDDNSQGEWRHGKERLFAAIVELLAAMAHSAPPVVLEFDDVHWCDEASAELLHYIVRMMRHRPMFLALAARKGELPDNEAMMRVLRGFRRDGWVEEIELQPLSESDTARLIQQVEPAAEVENLFGESAGNPLYIIELARAARQSVNAPAATLDGLIRDRIEKLPSPASEVLKWAAVLGGEFPLTRLTSLVSMDEEQVLQALETLERHGLLSQSPNAATMYRFAHNLVRRSVYDSMSEPRRRLMHLRVAQWIEQEPPSAASAAEIVHHAALAGEPAKAARAAARAGQYCLRVYANTEALAFASSGLRYAEALPEAERAGLQIELLDVSLTARRPRDVEETARRLESLAERALFYGDVEHARLGFHILSYLRWEGGDWADAKRHSLRAESVARGADTKEQVVAMAEAARCLALLERDLGQAEALALEARARASNVGVESPAIPDALGMLRLHQGAWDEAVGFFRTARDLSRQLGDRTGEFRALEHLVVLALERHDPHEANRLCADLVELAAKLREGSEAPFARCLAAIAAAATGTDNTDEIDAALESLRMADAKHRLAYSLLRATDYDFRRSDMDTARARAEEALRLATLLERPTEIAMAHLVLLRCALERDNPEEIRLHAEALKQTNSSRVAKYVQLEAERVLSGLKKGVSRGTGTRGKTL